MLGIPLCSWFKDVKLVKPIVFPDAGATKHLQQFSRVSVEMDGGEPSAEDRSMRCCSLLSLKKFLLVDFWCFYHKLAHSSVCCLPHQTCVFVWSAGMVGYGMAKAAVHQLCQSLAAKNSGMPSGAAAVAILPWVEAFIQCTAITPEGGQ